MATHSDLCPTFMTEANFGIIDLFSPEQEKIIRILITISSSLSLLGCIFILVNYIVFRDILNYFHIKLILYLTATDLFASM